MTLRHGDFLVHGCSPSQIIEIINGIKSAAVAEENDANDAAVKKFVDQCATRIRLTVSKGTGHHCSTVKDAVYHMRKGGKLDKEQLKRMCDVSKGYSLHKHVSQEWVDALLAEIEQAIEAARPVPAMTELPTAHALPNVADRRDFEGDWRSVPADAWSSIHQKFLPAARAPVGSQSALLGKWQSTDGGSIYTVTHARRLRNGRYRVDFAEEVDSYWVVRISGGLIYFDDGDVWKKIGV